MGAWPSLGWEERALPGVLRGAQAPGGSFAGGGDLVGIMTQTHGQKPATEQWASNPSRGRGQRTLGGPGKAGHSVTDLAVRVAEVATAVKMWTMAILQRSAAEPVEHRRSCCTNHVRPRPRRASPGRLS